MVALHYLKYQHDLSDEDVVALWVENPYWQQFSGMRHFQHQVAIDPSSMTRRRKRLGDAGAEQMLRATIAAGIVMRVIRPAELKRVNLDTTVETKAIRFPTDEGHCWKCDQRDPGSCRDELPEAPWSLLAHFSVLPDERMERDAQPARRPRLQYSTSICLKITLSGSTSYSRNQCGKPHNPSRLNQKSHRLGGRQNRQRRG
jgi:hypothetical protein